MWRVGLIVITCVGLSSSDGLLAQTSPADWQRPTLLSWPDSAGRDASDEDADSEGDDELEPLETDRPDFTEASTTVGRGVVQLESGYTYFESDQPGLKVRSHSIGEPLLRIGLWREWFEMRLAIAPAATVQESNGVRTQNSGWEDIYLGCKLALTEQAGWYPEVALVPQMTVPTGSAAFSENRVLPGTNLLYGWDLSERWSLGGSTQWNSAVDELDETYTEWAQSATVGWQINSQWKYYQEWFALFPDDSSSAEVEHYLNGGFTFLLSPDVQWDIRAGLGLNDGADQYFAGSGISFRFR